MEPTADRGAARVIYGTNTTTASVSTTIRDPKVFVPIKEITSKTSGAGYRGEFSGSGSVWGKLPIWNHHFLSTNN